MVRVDCSPRFSGPFYAMPGENDFDVPTEESGMRTFAWVDARIPGAEPIDNVETKQDIPPLSAAALHVILQTSSLLKEFYEASLYDREFLRGMATELAARALELGLDANPSALEQPEEVENKIEYYEGEGGDRGFSSPSSSPKKELNLTERMLQLGLDPLMERMAASTQVSVSAAVVVDGAETKRRYFEEFFRARNIRPRAGGRVLADIEEEQLRREQEEVETASAEALTAGTAAEKQPASFFGGAVPLNSLAVAGGGDGSLGSFQPVSRRQQENMAERREGDVNRQWFFGAEVRHGRVATLGLVVWLVQLFEARHHQRQPAVFESDAIFSPSSSDSSSGGGRGLDGSAFTDLMASGYGIDTGAIGVVPSNTDTATVTTAADLQPFWVDVADAWRDSVASITGNGGLPPLPQWTLASSSLAEASTMSLDSTAASASPVTEFLVQTPLSYLILHDPLSPLAALSWQVWVVGAPLVTLAAVREVRAWPSRPTMPPPWQWDRPPPPLPSPLAREGDPGLEQPMGLVADQGPLAAYTARLEASELLHGRIAMLLATPLLAVLLKAQALPIFLGFAASLQAS